MASLSYLLIVLLNLSSTVFSSDRFTRFDFPPWFIFGSGTSAYQVEDAAKEDGRTPSFFDTFADSGSLDGANGDIASDQYHKYKEDVQLTVETGLDAYRFSISWSRLIPRIQPLVTLHHTNLPQALEDDYRGWVSPKVLEDFSSYANVCFREFGDLVEHCSAFNEANIFIVAGYDVGMLPPQRCSYLFGINCTRGNSSTEPYLAGHYILLSHASAARLYKMNYQEKQHGFIGINLYAFCAVPISNTTEKML